MFPQPKSTNTHTHNSMESCGTRNDGSSGDMFSFPIPLGQDSDQPGSPADHLFLNGKLLPHFFPVPTPSNLSYSRSTSRTSSKGSLMSSRSNSTNSSSSSARTSTSEAASERKLISCERRERKKLPSYHHYESCQRWQLFAAPPQGPRSRSRSRSLKKGKIVGKGTKKGVDSKSWFGWKILKLFVSACKECHAIKT